MHTLESTACDRQGSRQAGGGPSGRPAEGQVAGLAVHLRQVRWRIRWAGKAAAQTQTVSGQRAGGGPGQAWPGGGPGGGTGGGPDSELHGVLKEVTPGKVKIYSRGLSSIDPAQPALCSAGYFLQMYHRTWCCPRHTARWAGRSEPHHLVHSGKATTLQYLWLESGPRRQRIIPTQCQLPIALHHALHGVLGK